VLPRHSLFRPNSGLVNAGTRTGMNERKPLKQNSWDKLFLFPVPIAIILLLIFLVYAQTLFFSLGKLDETNIILNNLGFLSDFRNLKECLLTNPFFNKGGDFYRPLQNLSFMIDVHLSGQTGWAFFLSNILIHFVTCSLIYYLLVLLGNTRKQALLLSLVFALHPLFVQTVAWAPSRGDLLLGMFGIASFIFFILYIRDQDDAPRENPKAVGTTGPSSASELQIGSPPIRGIKRLTNLFSRRSGNLRVTNRRTGFLLLNVLFFGLALMSKESAVIIPVICMIYYFLVEKGTRIPVSRLVIPAVIYTLLFLLFMYIRNEVVRIVVQQGQFGLSPFLVHLQTIPEFIAKFFLPVGLGPMPAFNLLLTLLGSVLMALFVIVLFRSRHGSWKVYLFGIAWFLLFVIPALMYINKFGSAACDYMEHRAYLPLVGILIFIGHYLNNRPTIKETRNLFAVILWVIPVLGIYTVVYARNYRTPMTYYNLAVQNNPSSAIALFNRGATRMNFEKDYPGAIRDYEKTMLLFPDYAESYINRGFCREQLKDEKGALADYEKAARLKPGWYEPHVDLGTVKRKLGMYSEAIREFDTVLNLSPLFYQAYNERGSLKTETDDYRGAMEDLNQAINMHENYPEAFFNRGILDLKLQDTRSALEDFDRAIQLDGKYTEAYVNRGILKYQMLDYPGAMEDFNRALVLNDQYAEAYLDRGMTRYMTQDLNGACEDWKRAGSLGLQEAMKLVEQYCGK
jgi:tetratricopeptide (TPR) repeat protein